MVRDHDERVVRDHDERVVSGCTALDAADSGKREMAELDEPTRPLTEGEFKGGHGGEFLAQPEVVDAAAGILKGTSLTEAVAENPALLIDDTVTLAVQVNGKLRGTVDVAKGAPNEICEAAALALPAVQKLLDGKPPRKVIVVRDKIVNIVAA